MSERSRKYRIEIDGIPSAVSVEERKAALTATFDGQEQSEAVRVLSTGPMPLVLVGDRVVAVALGKGEQREFSFAGHRGRARTVLAARAAGEERAALASSGNVLAPMPGRVVSVRVRAGDVVTAGAALVVVEAMKMQNELLAPRDATVARVLVNDGDAVERGAILVELA